MSVYVNGVLQGAGGADQELNTDSEVEFASVTTASASFTKFFNNSHDITDGGSFLSITASLSGAAFNTTAIDLEPGVSTPMPITANRSGTGLFLSPAFAEAASGTHAFIRSAYIDTPQITDGAATVTRTSVLELGDAASAGVSNWTLFAGAGVVNIDQLQIRSLPTADPTVAGRIWNDAGTLKVSAG